MQDNLSKKITDITKSFREDSVEILPGLDRNVYDIIKRTYYYRHDKYVLCSDPNAIFWQVVTPYIPHFSKLIDIDAKDLSPIGLGDSNYYQSWILRKKLQAWSEENNFNTDIDDLTKLVSSFGSFVWKWNEVTGKIEPCDLRNLAFDPTAKTVRETDMVEYHYLSEQEIRNKEWDNEDLILEKAIFENGKYEIWEYWGGVKEGEKYKYVHKIGCGYGQNEVIAFEEDSKKEGSPYFDFHIEEYDGTWLRKGCYERCFPEQERANTLVNENAQATSIASLLLLRSSDPNTSGNVLEQAISGQIINSSDLQQIGIDNRAFTVLLNELEKIEKQVQRKLMLPDIATGDSMPSGTPFRGMAVMSNAYKSAFKQIRARIATGIVDVMLEKILPSLVKDWNRGDILEIAGSAQDIKLYDDAIKNFTRVKVYARAAQNGTVVTPETEMELEKLADEAIKVNGRKLKTPKGFFNFKYGIHLDPVGETYDKGQQNDAIIQAITLTMQNPAITEIPAFKQLLENNGIPPFSLNKKEQQEIQEVNNPPAPGMLGEMLKKATTPVDTNA